MSKGYCPNCSIGLDYYQMKARKCNNCSWEFEVTHVWPVEDTEEHKFSYDCRCDPKIKVENGNLIVIHNSFDGREGVEWANEILQE